MKVSDGFNFGCGLLLALAFVFVILPTVAIVGMGLLVEATAPVEAPPPPRNIAAEVDALAYEEAHKQDTGVLVEKVDAGLPGYDFVTDDLDDSAY